MLKKNAILQNREGSTNGRTERKQSRLYSDGGESF